MTLPRLPTVKELVPYFFVMMVSAGGAMWLRLGENTASCDMRLAAAEALWQARFDRQEARIDSASAKVDRIKNEQYETFRRYFEELAKLKKR